MVKQVTIPQEVYDLFETLSFDIMAKGFTRYSARAVLHRIRWHFHIEKGNRAFKCNDHWTPTLARWFMDKHPHTDGFFETREHNEQYSDAA